MIEQVSKTSTCQAIKKDGTQCSCYPIRGTSFCYWHSTRKKAKKTPPGEIIPQESSFDLKTIKDINALLALVVKGLLAKKIDAKTANCIGYNLNILSRNFLDMAKNRIEISTETEEEVDFDALFQTIEQLDQEEKERKEKEAEQNG